MAGRDALKGLVVSIGGDTGPLSKALGDVNKKAKNLESELKEVNNALKLDPTNTTLLAQKQKLLADSISNTREKLDVLKNAEKQVQEQFARGEVSEEQYRAIQREVVKTEAQLKQLEGQYGKLENTSGNSLEQINQQTSKLDANLDGLNKTLAEVDKALRLDPTNTELLAKKQTLLSESIGATKEKLDGVKEAERLAQEQFAQGKISEEQYRAIQREVIKTESDLKALEDQYKKLGNAATQSLDNMAAKLDKAGKALAPFSAAVAGVGAAAIASFSQVDAGMDTVIMATGATGEKAQAMEAVFDNVASSIAADFGQIGGAIGEINTRFGYTGQQLEGCSEDFLKFARITGTDATESVRLVSRAMGDAGIEADEYKGLLDMLAKASQDSGIAINTLTENLAKYGAPMRQLELDINESIALFSTWEKAGVNTEIAFSGLKQAISRCSAQGKDAAKEFQKMCDEIERAPTLADASAKAIQIFGAKAGPDLADAIRGGRFELGAFMESLEASQGTVEATFNQVSDGMDDAKVAIQSGKLALAELGKSILKSFAPVMKTVAAGLKNLADSFQSLGDGTKRFIVVVGSLVAVSGPLLLLAGHMATSISSLIKLYAALTAKKIADTAATAVAASAQMGLNAALSANPAGMVVAGIAALTGGLAALAVCAQKSKDPIIALNTELKNHAKEMQRLEQTRSQTIQGGMAEIAYTQSLVNELKSLTDANGRVIKDKERVKFLTDEINKAAPNTIQWINDEKIAIEGGAKALDMLIEKKRAQIVLDAMEPEYKEAILNLRDREMKQAELSIQLDQQKTAYRQLEAEYAKTGSQRTLAYMNQMQGQIQKTAGALNNVTAAIENDHDAIDRYEAGAEAVASGNMERIKNFSSGFTDTLKDTRNMTKDEIFQQMKLLENAAKQQDEIARRTGSESAKRQAEELRRQSNELRKGLSEQNAKTESTLTKDYGNMGNNAGKALADSLQSKVPEVKAAGEALAKAASESTKKILDIRSPSRVFRDEIGKNIVLGLVQGIQRNTHLAVDSMSASMEAIRSVEINPPVVNPAYISNVSQVSQSTSSPTTVTQHINVTIPARDIRELSDVVRIFEGFRQEARARGL